MALVGVVGGAGFVGRRLVNDLQHAGHQVRVIDSASIGLRAPRDRKVDVRDRGGLVDALEGCQVVFNLAAVHRDDVRQAKHYNEVNVEGAVNIFAACRELAIERAIFTSSVAVYGLWAPDILEERTPAPVNAYGCSKLDAEGVHRKWQEEDPERRSLVIVRPTVVFGECNRGNVYELVRQIMARRFVMVGRGQNRKSMAYVGNLSAFLVHLLSLGAGSHLFNYTDKPDFSMEELVETILSTLGRRPVVTARIPYFVGYVGGVVCDLVAAVSGRSIPISGVRIQKFCSTTTFSSRRVQETGFRPPYGIREALIETIRHESATRRRPVDVGRD